MGFLPQQYCPAKTFSPPLKFLWFSLTSNVPLLLPPLNGLEKYLLVAGFASEMVPLIGFYSLFIQATKKY
jgi:hypothetical protein